MIHWQLITFFSLFLLGFYSIHSQKEFSSPTPVEIEGVFLVKKIENKKDFFRTVRKYTGVLSFKVGSDFFQETVSGSFAKDILTKKSYMVKGTLFPRNGRSFFRADFWAEKDKKVSLAYLRYKWKKNSFSFLKRTITHKESAELLHAITSGVSPSPFMRYQFRKLGLSHILAISGFHFGLIASFLLLLLRFVLPRIVTLFALLLISSCYLIYLGPSPSIVRAYLFLFFYIIANFFQRKTRPLNLLGAALLIQLLLSPKEFFSLSLQLSFLACVGIFFLYPTLHKAISSLFLLSRAKGSWHLKVKKYLAAALALSLSVQTTLLPLLLYSFHTFPLLGLFYNLFIPFIIVIAVSIFLLGFLLFPLQNFLFSLVSILLASALDLIYYHPIPWEYEIIYSSLSPLTLALYLLSILFFFPLLLYRKIDSCNFVPL